MVVAKKIKLFYISTNEIINDGPIKLITYIKFYGFI